MTSKRATTTGMPGNPKDSEWYSIAQSDRVRKKIQFTLSDEARERLDKMSKARKEPKSQVVERLILDAPIK